MELGPDHPGRVKQAARGTTTRRRREDLGSEHGREDLVCTPSLQGLFLYDDSPTVGDSSAVSADVDASRSTVGWDGITRSRPAAPCGNDQVSPLTTAENCSKAVAWSSSNVVGVPAQLPTARRNRWSISYGRETSESRSSSSRQFSGSSCPTARPCSESNNRRPRPRHERRVDDAYGGLYCTDDDLDTSAWDFVFPTESTGSASDVVRTQLTRVGKAPPERKELSVIDIIDQIEQEANSTGNVVAPPEGVNQEELNHSAEDSNEPPDPGALEGERERNNRLSDLLHLLTAFIFPAHKSAQETAMLADEDYRGLVHDASDSCPPSLSSGLAFPPSATMTSSSTLISPRHQWRMIEVLFRVMRRPRGPADASPLRIAELPGLLAGGVILRLLVRSIFIACPDGSRGSNETCKRVRTARDTSGQHLSLVKACRGLFDASKQAGADEFFFSSQVVKGLLGFVEQAAAHFASLLALEFFEMVNPDPSIGGLGEERDEIKNGGRDRTNSSGSERNTGETTTDCNLECTLLACVCDALTFAVGCLKNVSEGERLQRRLVQEGAVEALCKLVRSTRDVCHRYMSQDSDSQTFSCVSETPERQGILSADVAVVPKKSRAIHHVAALLRMEMIRHLAHSVALLRDLAVEKENHARFAAAGAVDTLCTILRPFSDQPDVVLNAARALAKLSRQEAMRRKLNADPSQVRSLLASLVEQGQNVHVQYYGLLETHAEEDEHGLSTIKQQDQRLELSGKCVAACVRLAFTLGNLTSTNDDNRQLIGIRLGGAESLPTLLQTTARAHLTAQEYLHATESLTVVDGPVSFGGAARAWTGESVSENSKWRRALERGCDCLQEMLVNIVRLLANIGVNRDVGSLVCRHAGLTIVEPLLGKCLEVFGLVEDGVFRRSPSPHSERHNRHGSQSEGENERAEQFDSGEELLLNVVSLVTNISFYGRGETIQDSSVDYNNEDRRERTSPQQRPEISIHTGRGSAEKTAEGSQPPYQNTLFTLASKARRDCGDRVVESLGEDVLCGHLVKVLLHPNTEAVAEAARAFGNFSRDPACREVMARRRADEVLVVLLSHARRDIVFAAAGALVNIAADPARKALFSRAEVGAGEKLARLVRRAGLADLGMAEIACQALHNLLTPLLSPGGVDEALGGAANRRQLSCTLKELFESCSSDALVDGRVSAEKSSEGEEGDGILEFGSFAATASALLGAIGEADRLGDPRYEELLVLQLNG